MSTPSPDELVDAAVAHHAGGRLADAEPLYRQAVAIDPDHADALHLLGLLLHQTGRSAEGEPLVRRAIAIDPNQSAFHTHLGLILTALGHVEPGLAAHRQAVAVDPASADAHHNLGVALAAAGRPAEAVDSYRRAVAIRPDNVSTWDNLARAETAAGHPAEAAAAYRRAIALDPASAQLHVDLGNALKGAGATDDAVAAFRRAAELAPASPVPLDNLGAALRQSGRPAEAMTAFAAALARQPNRPETLNHIGTVHCDAARLAEAGAAFEAALAGRPDFADAVNNLGTVREEQGRPDEAMALYERAVALAPDQSNAAWNLALMHLLRGEYAAGWAGYEQRWRSPTVLGRWRRSFAQPTWDGSPLDGRTILLHAEQGLGDAIQFARYAPLVAARGGRVIVECHPPLARLFGRIAGVDEVIGRGNPLARFDVHCPLMSLPGLFGTTLSTVPAEVPYLRPDPRDVARWRDRLATEPPGRRVGLVWAGRPQHQRDRDRSLSPDTLAPLSAVPGVRLYSLQVGRPAPPWMVDWTADLHDLADTAALASALDLVVTVDTAVAHLCGALGVPTWVLVPFVPDWRWLLGREDSPWYPTARLFRQDTPRDWRATIGRVAATLADPP